MAETTVSPPAADLNSRVAVLKEIARASAATFADIRSELRDIRSELRAIRAEAKADYRWIIGIMLGGFAMTIGGFAGLLAVMAHGFKWL